MQQQPTVVQDKQTNIELTQSSCDSNNELNIIQLFPLDCQLECFQMLHQSNQQTYETSSNNLGNVCLSQISKSSQIHLSSNQLVAYGGQRHSTVTSTHGIYEGKLIFEVQFKYNSEYLQNCQNLTFEEQRLYKPQCRIGVEQQQRDFTVPLGIQQNSICLRSVDCCIVQNGKRYYQNEDNVEYNPEILSKLQNRELSLQHGDVVTIIMDLPQFDHVQQLQEEVENVVQQSTQNEQELMDMIIKVCEKQENKQQVINEIIPNSSITFFVNGMYIAQVKNILFTRYYAAASIYNFGQVEFNFGQQNIKVNYYKDFYVLPQCLNGGSRFGLEKLDLVACKQWFQEYQAQMKLDFSKIKITDIQNQTQDHVQIPVNTRKIAKLYNIDAQKLYQFQQQVKARQQEVKQFDNLIKCPEIDELQAFKYLQKIISKYPQFQDVRAYNMLYMKRASFEYNAYINIINQNIYNQDLHLALLDLFGEDGVDPSSIIKSPSINYIQKISNSIDENQNE